MKHAGIIILLFFLSVGAMAQGKKGIALGTNYEGDTIPHVQLSEIKVQPRPTFESRRLERKYRRLIIRVKKTYPYAIMAAETIEKFEQDFLLSDASERERKKHLKELEKELFAKYGEALKKMSISDGRILIKLIDRETQNTSYELIKDLKGGTSAFFWQGIAKLFGNDLKNEFNPDDVTEDEMIEQILLYMKYGII